MNIIKQIDLNIQTLEKFKNFMSNYTKNLLSKNNINDIFNMDNSQFENYINKLKKNLDKYNFNNTFKEVFIKSVKNSYNLKYDTKENLKTKYFESAKKDIDNLCESEKKDIKENYALYMIKINLIFQKYIDLNIYEKNMLIKYFLEKKNISKNEFLILNINFIIKFINKKVIELKSEKEILISGTKFEEKKLIKKKSIKSKDDKSAKDDKPKKSKDDKPKKSKDDKPKKSKDDKPKKSKDDKPKKSKDDKSKK